MILSKKKSTIDWNMINYKHSSLTSWSPCVHRCLTRKNKLRSVRLFTRFRDQSVSGVFNFYIVQRCRTTTKKVDLYLILRTCMVCYSRASAGGRLRPSTASDTDPDTSQQCRSGPGGSWAAAATATYVQTGLNRCLDLWMCWVCL